MKSCFFLFTSLIFFCDIVFASTERSIVVSIPPLQFLMEKIVGEDAKVISLVPKNNSPELFKPTPKQIVKVKQADLYFSLGLPFESKWVELLSESKDLVVNINCCPELKTLSHSDHAHHHDSDPHIWTDPILLIEIARSMLVQLNTLYPEKIESYQKSFEALVNQLQELDQFIKKELEPFEKNIFIVTHPAWSYYAKRYGLEQVSLEQEGREIGIKARKRILDKALEKNIKYIFSIEQLHPRSANVIADELNAKIVFIDHLAYDYVTNLELTTQKLVQSFKE